MLIPFTVFRIYSSNETLDKIMFRDKEGDLNLNFLSVIHFLNDTIKLSGYLQMNFLQGFEWYIMRRLISI